MNPVVHQLVPNDSLPPGAYFRTLVLQPGVGEEPLQCSLQASLLGDVRFEAISYVWGSDVKDYEILCEGQTIAITTNLWIVLRHVRSNVPRVLWADSICINQEDLEEKAHQVGMMGQIYRSASRVLIFIGLDDFGHGANVSSLLHDMSDMIRPIIEHPDTDLDSFPHLDDDAPILRDARWKSFDYLLEQNWFTRGWVVQEAALAKEGQVIWGDYELNWSDLTLTFTWMLYRAFTLSDKIYERMTIHGYLYWHYEQDVTRAFTVFPDPIDYLEIIDAAKNLQFSDPRDRIFAFGDIAQDFGRKVRQPNYNIPFLHVYQQFAIDNINHNKDITILDYVRHTEESLHDTVPSWSPRWEYTTTTLARSRSTTTVPLTSRSCSIQEPVFIDPSILRLRGVIVDTVAYTSKVAYMTVSETSEIIQDIWKDVRDSKLDSPYPAANLVDVFLDVLGLGQYIGDWSKWRRDTAACALHLLENTSDINADEQARRKIAARDGDIDQALSFIRLRMYGERLILTKRGYMGLAPQLTREGDTCAILFGCTTPCILQKTGSGLQYRLVGSTVILGKQPREHVDCSYWCYILGSEHSKDWAEWDVEEQDIDLC
jgi:hypothetical protein